MNLKNLSAISAFVASSALFAQTGINTQTPSATLDILSEGTSSATKALEVNNNSNEEILNIYDNGNVYIKSEILPANNSGLKGYLLSSRGANTSLQWVASPIGNAFEKVIAVAFNGSRTSNTSYYAAGSQQKISINNTNLTTPDIGNWNNSTHEFTVSTEGIYHITVGANINASSNSNLNGSIWIHAASLKQGIDAIVDLTNSYNLSASGVLTAHLMPGDRIYVYAQSNRNWRIQSGFINVSYSKPSNL